MHVALHGAGRPGQGECGDHRVSIRRNAASEAHKRWQLAGGRVGQPAVQPLEVALTHHLAEALHQRMGSRQRRIFVENALKRRAFLVI